MSDIVFYQQYGVPYFGILSIASHLKYSSHTSDVIIDSLEDDSIDVLRRLKPKLIGISALSTEHNWLIDRTKAIRRVLPDTIVIVGGIHAMFYYEEILSETPVDLVCHSEGEEVLLNVITEMNKAFPDWESIQGISYRVNGNKIQTNERAWLVPFRDDIVEDRSIYYDRYPQLKKDAAHRFFSSRGCPYRCSFCYNANIHDLFRGKGAYIRQKSVDNFIREITTQCSKYPIKFIFFYDDLFTFRKKWLREFLKRYKEEVSIPFWCTTRADLINESTARLLADAGCRTVSYGIETGNYALRKNVLNKNITDEQIVNCGRLLRKYGVKTQTANMFCLPDETLEDAFKTIELNIKAETDYAFSALFMPFPKTEITNYCITKGLLKPDFSVKDMPYSFLTASVLDVQDKDAITNVHHLAYFFIRWPWVFKGFKRSVHFTFLGFFFRLVFLFGTFLRHKGERGISLWPALRYAWRLRDSF